jgi:hypothetical protein
LAKEPAPTVADILKLRSACETQYRADDQQIRAMREIRNMESAIGIAPELMVAPGVEVHDPTITDEIARVVATMSKYDPTIHCAPSRPTDTGYEAATRIERWTWETLMAAATRIPGINTLHTNWDALLADGGCWSKLLFRPDTWEERYGIKLEKYLADTTPGSAESVHAREQWDEDTETAKKRAGPPFYWIPVDAATVYPVWDGGRLSEVIEVQHRQSLPSFRRDNPDLLGEHIGQPLSRDEATGSGTNDIEFIEHWTREWVTYVDVRNKAVVKQWRHGYGRVPYVFALGITHNEWRGRKIGWGVAHNKRSLSAMRSMLLTLMAQDALRWVQPPILLERPDTAEPLVGNDGAPVDFKEVTFRVGGIYEGGPGIRWAPFPSQSVSPALREMATYVSNLEAQLDTPRVTSEIGGALAGAGYAVNQVLVEAKTKHDPFIKAMVQMLEDVVKLMWHLTRTRVKETVWVSAVEGTGRQARTQWIGAGEDDLKQIVGVRVEIDPQDPSARLVEERLHKELVDSGFESRDQAIEALGFNPDEVRLGIALDQMRAEEWYKAFRNKQILETLGRGDLLKQAANQAAQTGILPGMPPEMQQQIMAQRQMAQAQQAANPQGPPPQAMPGVGRETPEAPPLTSGLGIGQGRRDLQNGATPGIGPGLVVPERSAAAAMTR